MTPKRSLASPSEPSPTPLFDFAADSPESTQAPKRGRRPKATQETEPTQAPKRSRTAKKSPSRSTKKAADDATPQELPPNERPFAVPKNWLWTRLGDVATIYNGNSINAKEKAEKYSTKCAGLSFIATKDVGFDSVIDYENGIYIPQAQTTNFKIAPPNSALLCMEGGSAGRKVGLLEQDVCFGNKLCCFAPLFFDGRYLFNYLRSPDFFAEFKRQLAGLIGGVGTQKLKAIPIPVPPLAEISRIVALVERLFARLDEAAEIVRETLEQIDLAKKALLAQAFRGELGTNDPNDEKPANLDELPPNERPFEIPENWLWTRLGEVATVYNGNSINAQEKAEKYSTKCAGLSFVATKDVGFDSVIDYENGIYIPQGQTKDFKIAPRNSALLCMEGGSAGRKVGLLEQDVCFGNKLCCFAPLFFDGRYLFNYLRSPDFFAEFKRQLAGLIGGVGTQKLKAIPIPVPPLVEISRIVALIERQTRKYDEARELAEETAAQIETLKKAILARAFRGELGTNDPADPKPFATAPTT